MIPTRPLSFAFVFLIALSSVLGGLAAQNRAENSEFQEFVEQDEIKHIIESYFEVRYHSLNTLQLEGFEDFISKSSEGDKFFHSELDKLELEIQHAKRYHLRYSQYEFFLEFQAISIDLSQDKATVSVIEGHDVIFEISEEIIKSRPIVSSMRNLQHTITMRKELSGWKIISDTYEDYLWRLMKATGVSKEVLLQSMAESLNQTPSFGVQAVNTCSLPSDESTHPYNRNGAVAYSHRWATAEPPYNNPPYYDFTNLGGDCTNFVSQAIHEGGTAQMVGSNTYGWYYNNLNDRAAAWTDVTAIHDFITQYWVWPTGPEGCDVAQYQAYEGDLIQYDWTNDSAFDHSVIIVRSEDYGYQNRYHWVSGHSDDVDNYPFTSYLYDNPNMVYRFVRIERIDGYAMVYLPLVIKSGSGMFNQLIIPNPYPAPLENDTLLLSMPYPAP